MYFNPGFEKFHIALNSEIYVDKTEMILYLNTLINTNQRFVSVSRPRRFGKSMAIDMLCAYYEAGEGSRPLFEKTTLGHHEDWDSHLGCYDVLCFSMLDFMTGSSSMEEALQYLTEELTDELMSSYPDVHSGSRTGLRILCDKVYAHTGRKFVFLIDEWDAVFRSWPEDREGQKVYLDFLRDLLKDRAYVALAYMTGILPIKKYGQHSALNMFDEYSMITPMQLAPFTGFTEAEVRNLCRQYNMSYESLSSWYDGYIVSDRIPVEKRSAFREGSYDDHRISIYSPLSVVKSISTGFIQNYWNHTETYEALAEYIRKDFDGLKESVALLMDGGRVQADISGYQNDMTTLHSRDDVLSLLIHLGYLGYDTDSGEVFIPNREILDEFKTSTRATEWEPTFYSYDRSKELLLATWNRDAATVSRILEEFHDRADNKTYNSEAALSYAVQYAYYAAQKYYTTIRELDTGKGYADLVYLPAPQYPDKPALLIELKFEKTAQTALEQIKRNHYPQLLEHYRGNTLLIGINYNREANSRDPGFKRHSCVIENA